MESGIALPKTVETQTLNSHFLGTLLRPTYKVFVLNVLLKVQNTLVINVSNSMANRVIAIEKQGKVWQKFYNINISQGYVQIWVKMAILPP